jgi:hypothetical protein
MRPRRKSCASPRRLLPYLLEWRLYRCNFLIMLVPEEGIEPTREVNPTGL